MPSLLSLNVDISKYEDRLADDLSHFCAESKEHGTIGFGTDSKPEVALLKAISECVERSVMRSVRGPNSNGFAAHNSRERAGRKALLECKERDAFLLGWLAERPPFWLTLKELNLPAETVSIINHLSTNGFDAQFGLVATNEADFVIVGAIRAHPSNSINFGVVLSSASANSIEGAILGTALELRRAATVVINRAESGTKTVYHTPSNLPTDGRSTFEFYLDPLNAKSLDFYFDGRMEPLNLDFPDSPITFYDCRVVDPKLNVIVAHCDATGAQPLFFGMPKDEDINFMRFKRAGLIPKNKRVMPLP